MSSDDPRLTPDNERWRENWPPPSYWIKVGLALIGTVAAIFLLGTLRGILLVLLASFVLAIGFQPAIGWFERRGMRRGFGLGLVLMGFLVVIGGMLALALPLIVTQAAEIIEQLPALIEDLQAGDGLVAQVAGMIDLEQITSGGTSDPETVFEVAGNLAGFAFNTLTVLLVTPYFAMSMPGIKRWLVRLLRPRHREDFILLVGESTDLMANFIVGNVIVSVIAGVVTWVGLTLIGVPYALALAAWVAITDLIPVLGALLGAAGVAVVAYAESPEALVWALALLLVYQQLENFVIAPRVMNKAVDLSPATVIIALMVGGSLAGLVGALLALPLAALIKVVIEDYIVQERVEAVRTEVTNGEGVGKRSRRRRGARPLP
ncbi:MAG TPA: AI-2E family transporter [Acidimicrobiia bacterium]|nr:AI-2E family transporter [Acidimicrobiia bacterium]